ncbi:MAG TPA: hypothetical protein VH743_07460 [Beijerinckiaceae bacterium]
MAQDYAELVAYCKAHKSDAVALAKALTAWGWASLLPGGMGTTPTSAQQVPSVLNASCGWRDVLMKALFAEIGIEGRRVNFYDVPYQGGHTATELKIGGKWMFFDATFGIYFEPKGGGAPLSIAQVREQWPAVQMMQSSLPGWQGTFIDPDAINPTAYQVATDSFMFMPTSMYGMDDVVGGELNSIYLGGNTAYYINNQDIPVVSGDWTWQTYQDTAGTKSWQMVNERYESGRLDFLHGLNDNGSRWFVDYDQAKQHVWATVTTYVTERSVLDVRVTLYDDGTKLVLDNDQARAQAWDDLETYYTASGALDRQTIIYDDGSKLLADWDAGDRFEWSSIKDSFDANGQFVSRVITGDDGSTSTITAGPLLAGTNGGETLGGTPWSDELRGLDGNDILIGGGGSDTIDGGAGTDRVIFSGRYAEYTVTDQGVSGLLIAGRDGTSVVTNVEQMTFADRTYLPAVSTATTADAGGSYAWASVTSYYDYLGRTLSVLYVNDDSTQTAYAYDVADQFAWDETYIRVDGQGHKLSDLYYNDAGTRTGYTYDVLDHFTWSRVTTLFDAAWRVTSTIYDTDSGTMVVYQNDVGDRSAWSRIQTDFNAAGQRTSVKYANDDGSLAVYNYDVGNRYNWSSVATLFGDDGRRDSATYVKDDGSQVVYTYGADGVTII